MTRGDRIGALTLGILSLALCSSTPRRAEGADAPPTWVGTPPSRPAGEERAGLVIAPATATVLVIATNSLDSSVLLALNELGLTYDFFYSAGGNFSTVDLSPYAEIFVGMNGGYVSQQDIAHLAAWTNAGGILHFVGGSGWLDLALGVDAYLVDLQEFNYFWTIVSSLPHLTVTDPSHYLASGIAPTLNFVEYGASYYMARLEDPAAEVAAVNGDGWPCLFSKEVGAGLFDWFINVASSDFWYNPADYAVLKQVIANMLEGGRLQVLPAEIREGVEPGAGTSREVTLRNKMDVDVQVQSIAASQPWLGFLMRAAGGPIATLPPDSSLTFGVTLDAALLPVGVYGDTILVAFDYLPPPPGGGREGRFGDPILDTLRVPVTLGVTHAPQITGPATASTTECQSLDFVATADDADGDPLAWFAVDLPEGATIDGFTGIVVWENVTVPVADALVPLTYGVSDGFLADTSTTMVEVRELQPFATVVNFDDVADDSTGGGEITGEEWIEQGVRFTASPYYPEDAAIFNIVGLPEYHLPVSPPNALTVVNFMESSYGSGVIEVTFPPPGGVDGLGTVDFFGGWITGYYDGARAEGGGHDGLGDGVYVQVLNAKEEQLASFTAYSDPASFCWVYPGEIARVRISNPGYPVGIDDIYFGHLSLHASVSAIHQGVEPGGTDSREITLRNYQDSPIVVQDVAATQPWLDLEVPLAGALPETLDPTEALTFGVTLDAGVLPVDVYLDTIEIPFLTAAPPAARWLVPDTLRIPVTFGVTHRPLISGPASAEGIECRPVEFTVEASDPDGDALTYSLVESPAGFDAYIDAETGEVVLETEEAPIARYVPLAASFAASDGFLADTVRTTIQLLEVPPAAILVGFDTTAAGDPIAAIEGGGEITGEEWLSQGVRFQAAVPDDFDLGGTGVLNIVDTLETYVAPISLPNALTVSPDSFSTYGDGTLEITFAPPSGAGSFAVDYVGGAFARDTDYAPRAAHAAAGWGLFVSVFDEAGVLLEDQGFNEYDGGEFCFAYPGRIARVEVEFNGTNAGLDDFWFGSFDPRITLAVLQNPVLTNQVDIYAAPTISLEGAPAILVGGEELEAEEIGEGATMMWRARFLLEGSGNVSVSASGISTIAERPATGALEFTSFAVGREGGAMASRDGRLEVAVPAGAVSEAIYLTIQGPGAAAQSPYEIGPAGRAVPGLEARFRVTDPEHSTVWLKRGEAWEEVPTFYDRDSGVLVARPAVTGPLAVRARTTGGETPPLARRVSLAQNAPNPFGHETWIAFELAKAAPVQLRVFDVRGRAVRTLADGVLEAGLHRVRWDGRDEGGERFPPGVYFYRLEHDGKTLTRRMVLVPRKGEP